jgi:hypothetical protein
MLWFRLQSTSGTACPPRIVDSPSPPCCACRGARLFSTRNAHLANQLSIGKNCDYFNRKLKTLKNDLQKALGVACYEHKWIDNINHTNVFLGFAIGDSVESRESRI